MKTQLVHLETHDDLVSIRDKMAWAKTPRILLVWPRARAERVDVRPLDLELLRRHAVSLGAELGLVTRDGEIRAAARRINLPVFGSASEAQRKTWPLRSFARPGRRFAPLDLRAIRASLRPSGDSLSPLGGTRLAIFAIGVLAALTVVLVFIPSAEIRMTAPTRSQGVKIAVRAGPDAAQVSLSGVVPAREMTFDLEESDSIPATGRMVLPDQSAEGDVGFTNLAAAAVEVPAGTVVVTHSNPPARFATVEAAQLQLGKGSTATAHIRALSPGSDGNVPSGSILAFEGPLGLSVAVTNPLPTGGGADVTKASPTDGDRRTLRERLLVKIKDHAKNRLPAQLQPGDVFFPSTFVFSKVLDESATPAPDQPGDRLALTLRVEFRAYYAAAADLNQLAARVLDASLPPGYSPLDGTLTVKAVSPLFGGADGNMRWEVQAARTLRARIDPLQVIYLVQGQTAGRAGSLLQQTFGLETAPQISIQPFFWPWLPSLPFRINVAG